MSGASLTRLHASMPASAEEWAARLSSHDVSVADRAAFTDWLNADISNRQAFDEVRRLETLPEAFQARPEMVADLLAEVVPASIAAGIALVGIAALLAPRLVDGNLQRVATRHGEQRSITLPDGSVVQLNTDTQITYRVDNSVRRVNLESGEAFFDVAKDASRTFVVNTDKAEIQVVGTQFTVRRLANEVEVVVKEGKVKVVSEVPLLSTAPAERVDLTPGNRLLLASAGTLPQVALVDVNRATSWRTGVLDIDGMTLEEVVAEVNRYVASPFVIEDESIRRLLLSGRFRVGDTESIRFMLRERLNVESQPRDGGIALRAAQS